MTLVALIRHAPTTWNDERLIQGRSDTTLSEAGIALARSWRVPEALTGMPWVTSTLSRTRDTARHMGLEPLAAEPRLDEMDWGHWAGRSLADLRAEHGAAMAENEALGLDFRPSGGETPREVQRRLSAWLRDIAEAGADIGAITHRGVQRAAIGLATGWDFLDKPPLKLGRSAILLLALDEAGSPRLERTDLSLDAS